MLKSTLAAAALALCASAASAASSITVDFNAYLLEGGNAPVLAGSFAGSDTNNDGVLSFSELTSFNVAELQDVGVATPLTLADLSGFGSYTIATNTWEPNGASWDWAGDVAYFTWDGGESSANIFNTRVSTSVVPEPASLAMMGLGTLALLARRRRRAD